MTAEEVGRLAFENGIPVLWLAAERSRLEEAFFALTADAGLGPAGQGGI
jgi:hypothetical protein